MEQARDTTKDPILALTIFCMQDQVTMIEKLQEALEYIKSLTPNEFEGKHEVKGSIIKIINLQ